MGKSSSIFVGLNVDEYVANHNTDPKAFIWTNSARDILQAAASAASFLPSLPLIRNGVTTFGAIG